MSESPLEIESIEILADSFLERYRRGERPDPEEYAARHPELAGQIRDLFPALVALEAGGSVLGETGNAVRSAVDSDEPPRQLGDFRILREVGRGGMGVVYEAVQESLGRHVALKVLPFHGLTSPTQRERFRREALAAARLHHTNIVPVFGVGECAGVEYYAMQFIQGLGLDEVLNEVRRIRSHGPASPDLLPPRRPEADVVATVARSLVSGEFAQGAAAANPTAATTLAGGEDTHAPRIQVPRAGMSSGRSHVSSADSLGSSQWSAGSGAPYYRSVATVGLQVAEALDHAHSQGILHRDIKPSNLLLDTRGAVWVTDFGLAKAEGSDNLTQTGDIVGTLRYMAPERFQGQSTASSDVYSLGLTLYELLTTRPAFEGINRARIIEQLTREDPAPPRKLDPRIPRDLETIVSKAIAKEPARRYATAGELAEDLKRFLEDRPIQARRIRSAERAWRWCRRNPAPAGAIATVAAALVTVAVGALFYADRERRFAEDSAEAAKNLASSLKESSRRLAAQQFQRGQAAFEKGDIGPGLLWTIESWKSAVEASDPAWTHAARGNLAAWSLNQPKLRAVLSHDRPVTSVAVSPDGKRAATRADDSKVRLWDLDTGRPVGPPLSQTVDDYPIVFSPDGTRLATAGADRIDFWDPATGRALGSTPNPLKEGCTTLAFSPDSRRLFIGTWYHDIQIDLIGGKVLGPLSGPTGYVRASAFSPDGKTILSGSWDGVVRLWDATTREPDGAPLQPQKGVFAVAFSPDGKTFAAGCADGLARVWDTATRKAIEPPLVHQGEVRGVAFSPDGKIILTGSVDRTARVWDAVTHAQLGTIYTHEGPIEAVAITPDGKRVLTAAGDSTTRVWDLDVHLGYRGGMVVAHRDLITAVAFSPDGKTIVTGSLDRTARLWDAATGRPLEPVFPHPNPVYAVTFSPDGKTLLTGCDDAQARLWDIASGRILAKPLRQGGRVTAVAFSPDGEKFLAGDQYAVTRLWKTVTRELLGEPLRQSGSVDSAAFSPDGKSVLTGDAKGGARLWDVASGKPLGPIVGHPGRVSAVAFSPDGKGFVIGGEDGTARLWDVITRKPLTPPFQHRAWIFGLAFSPDGKMILSGSHDRTARFWDVATGMPIGPPLLHSGDILAVAFSPDGKTVLTTDGAQARLSHMAPPLPDDLGRCQAWAEVAAGLKLDATGSVEPLDNAAWLAARDRLEAIGGFFAEEDLPRPKARFFRANPLALGELKKQLVKAQTPGDIERVAEEFDHLLFTVPDEWYTQSAMAEINFEIVRRDRLFAAVLKLRPSDPHLWIARGRFLAWLGRLEEAATGYEKALPQLRLHENEVPLEYLSLLLLKGDRETSRHWCEWLARDPDWNNGTFASYSRARAVSVVPRPGFDPGMPIEWAKHALTEARFPWYQHALAMAFLRAGRYRQAVELMEDNLRRTDHRWIPEIDWLGLALAHHHLGQAETARRYLEMSQRWLDHAQRESADKSAHPSPPIPINDWLEFLVLHREAEALIRLDPDFPADPFSR